jgi:hypothetical protein
MAGAASRCRSADDRVITTCSSLRGAKRRSDP